MSHPNPDPVRPHPRNVEPRITESAEEARQGRPGRPVWFVLVVSTALAAAILGIVLLFFTGSPEAALVTR